MKATPEQSDSPHQQRGLRRLVVFSLAAILLLFGLDVALMLLATVYAIVFGGGLLVGGGVSPHFLLIQERLLSVDLWLAAVAWPLALIFVRSSGLAVVGIGVFVAAAKAILRMPLRSSTGELACLLLLSLAVATTVTTWSYFQGHVAAHP